MSEAFTLRLAPLTAEAFAPYGRVIEPGAGPGEPMNDGTLTRWRDVAGVDLDETGAVALSVARCDRPMSLPTTVRFVERHPLGSQTFVPLTVGALGIVVALPGPSVAPSDLRGFVTDGRQGVHYHRGVWHRPLIVFTPEQTLLIVERGGPEANCEEHHFESAIEVVA